MSQSLAQVLVHIVYSTKNRRPWLKDPHMRSELYAYNAAILKSNVNSPAILINGVEDHLHMLCSLSRKVAIQNVIRNRRPKHPNGSRSRGRHTPIFIGRRGTEFSLSARPISNRSSVTSPARKSTIGGCRFRKSFEKCAGGTELRLMNVMRGNDACDELAPLGLGPPRWGLCRKTTRLPRVSRRSLAPPSLHPGLV